MDFTTQNRGTRTSLKEFEKDLLKEGLLRLRPFFKKTLKGVSLENFIKGFLHEYNQNPEIETVFIDTEESQCEYGCRRSGGDIFRICKYYYPKCTLEEVLTILDRLISNEEEIGDGDEPYIKSNICRQIYKRVFIAHDCSCISHNKEKDEFNRVVGEYSKSTVNEGIGEDDDEFEVDDED